ncbi:hypothetical protein T440DRAFT_313523 [Plenodomus tracheiphilus IPT5]|uniref:Uncharacterized protein n=1 Tax=Plenodomus tracheiphilus IPT5 TaxID=1408161 RepID=A0A6A7BGX3_9PLEO|nr:hypothetical protein T440DRAFT_313523 [Plenodomus tracheiphilus IPT5]
MYTCTYMAPRLHRAQAWDVLSFPHPNLAIPSTTLGVALFPLKPAWGEDARSRRLPPYRVHSRDSPSLPCAWIPGPIRPWLARTAIISGPLSPSSPFLLGSSLGSSFTRITSPECSRLSSLPMVVTPTLQPWLSSRRGPDYIHLPPASARRYPHSLLHHVPYTANATACNVPGTRVGAFAIGRLAA